MHVDDKEKLPICRFFKELRACYKGDLCLYRHVYPEQEQNNTAKIPGIGINNEPCPFYERGFCAKG